MSEFPSAGVAENSAGDRAEALSPEAIERLLADFRSWLTQAAERGATSVIPPDAEPAIDLHTLLSQFVALRHEIHLQTKAARSQQELSTETLERLGQALEMLRQTQASQRQQDQQAETEQLRPLLKTLVDVADALGLARREVQRVQDALTPSRDGAIEAPMPASVAEEKPALPAPRPSFWARWFGTAQPEAPTYPDLRPEVAALRRALAEQQERQRQSQQDNERLRQAVASILTGYTMSMQRLERTLQQHELEPIPAVGEPFNPEEMEVVEAATGTGLPSGQVIEEVRRGFRWRGRVFRYAQVRVAKN